MNPWIQEVTMNLSTMSLSGLAAGRTTAARASVFGLALALVSLGLPSCVRAELTTTEVKNLHPSSGSAGDNYGRAVALAGDIMVVGAYRQSGGKGAVYIHYRNQGGADQWGLRATLWPAPGSTEDLFGFAVAIDNNTVVVGAPGDDDAGTGAGAVYVFEQNQGGADQWGLVAKLKPEDRTGHWNGIGAGDDFGCAVAISDAMLVAGAKGDDTRAGNAGAVYVYHRFDTVDWSNAAKLTAADGAGNDYFGYAVALYGNTVAVGAPYDDDGGDNSGSVYIHRRHRDGADQWGFVKRLSGTMGNQFGSALAMDESLLVVGEPKAGVTGHQGGGAQLFERHLGGPDHWGRVGFPGASASPGDDSGRSVAVRGDLVLVGSPGNDDRGEDAGVVRLYRRDAGGCNGWQPVATLHAQGSEAGDRFGSAVALDHGTLACGAMGDDPRGESSGSVRVFERTANRWFLEQTITAHDGTGSGWFSFLDGFGLCVAMSYDTLAVGAPDRDDDGLVYLYSRNAQGPGAPWSFLRTIVGSRRGVAPVDSIKAGDCFGSSVALAGDHLLVGAIEGGDKNSEHGFGYFFNRNRGGPGAWGETGRIEERLDDYFDWHGELGHDCALTEQTAAFTPGEANGSSGHGIRLLHLATEDQWADYRGRSYEATCHKGLHVAIRGDALFELRCNGTYDCGARADTVQLYRREVRAFSGTSWTTNAWGRVGGDLIRRPQLGRRIDVDGNTLVVGVHDDVLADPWDDGWRLEIFERNAGGAEAWGRTAIIHPPDPDGRFAPAVVSLCGNRLAVGTWNDDVLVYERNTGGGGHWGLAARIGVCAANDRAIAGSSASWEGSGDILLRDDRLVIGAPFVDKEQRADFGAVHVYRLDENHAPGLDLSGDHAVQTGEDRIGAQAVPWKAEAFLLDGGLVTDTDGDRCGIAVTAIANLNGRWAWSIDAGATWHGFGTLSDAQAQLLGPNDLLRFEPNRDFHGTVDDAITFRAWDLSAGKAGVTVNTIPSGGHSAFSEAREHFAVIVNPANDIPVLDNSGTIYLTPIDSRIADAANTGDRVADLIAGRWSDVDGETCGLAVTAVAPSSGRWQFSTGAGQPWLDFGHPTPSEARLLAPNARIRFVPNPGYIGTVFNGVYFRAWDQASGKPGGAGNVLVTGGFSSEAESLHIVVSLAVNRAPVLDSSGTPAFSSIVRNQTDNPGDSIQRLIHGLWTDADGDTCGMALMVTDTSHGTWQYRLSKAATWTAVGSVSSDAALLLGPGAALRFLPALDYVGTLPNAIRFRAWDQTGGTAGQRVNLFAVGGSSPMSQATEYAGITVADTANRAPVLDNTGVVFVTDVRPNSPYNQGDHVRDLIAPIVADPDGHACGIVAVNTYTYYGPWQYSLDDGQTWQDVGAVTMSSARLLGPEAKVRFWPNAGYSGTINQGLGFRAWDQTTGQSGERVAVGAVGGGSPFSALAEYLSVRTLKENHAPVLDVSRPLNLAAIRENEGEDPGDQVADLIRGIVTDVDGDVCGIAVGNVNHGYGLWQWSTNLSQWHDFSPVSSSSSRLLGPDARVRYRPYLDWHGTNVNGLSFRAWDRTVGTNGASADATATGGQSAFSSQYHQASIVVREANLPPTRIQLAPASILENQPPGTTVGVLTTQDPNSNDIHTFSLVSGAGDADTGAFTIVTNQLRTAIVFDRETRSTRAIRVRADDGQDGIHEQPLTVAIADVNDSPPMDVLLAPGRIQENEPAGTRVGQFTTVDLDLADTHVYALVAGPGDGDNAHFAVVGDGLYTTAALDFEAKPQCRIRVRSDDTRGGTIEKALIILVVDRPENRPPTLARLYPHCLFGDETAGTTVGILAVYDPDAGDTVACSLTAGEGDTDNARFRIDGRALRTTAPLDFAGGTPYRIRVRFDDGAGGTLEERFAIVQAEILFADDVEQGARGWTHAADLGTDPWTVSDGVARSPIHAFTAPGSETQSDTCLVSPILSIPQDALEIRFEFHHQTAFADQPGTLDAAVLEMRLEDGPWLDAVGFDGYGYAIQGGYHGSVVASAGNPLAGREAWTTNSVGFDRTVIVLNPSACRGRSVQFRWRFGTDSLAASPGWWIDDIRLGLERVAASEITLVEYDRDRDTITLNWSSVPGRIYRVEATTRIAEPTTWVTMTEDLAGQAGTSTVVVDLKRYPGYPVPALFLRMLALP
jgi:hypothetical protein